MKAIETRESVPVFDASQFDGPADLMLILMIGTFPTPCWIRVGKESFRVTTESRDSVARGIRLALAMQEAR